MLANNNYYRNGPDYRHGEQVDFLDIKQTFGFYHIRVGSWVTKEESQKAANLIFDSLADLAFVLNLPPHAIGLRESLSLAFGHGGRKHVQAHYDVNARQLALAKNAGAGALAHEFWHAFDHYIAEKAFVYSDVRKKFASDLWLLDQPMRPHPLNDKLHDIFKIVLLSECGNQPSEFVANSIKIDKKNQLNYYSQPTEIMARAFEACIETGAEIKNTYLVSGSLETKSLSYGIFPEIEQRKVIMRALLNYFNPLGMALSQ